MRSGFVALIILLVPILGSCIEANNDTDSSSSLVNDERCVQRPTQPSALPVTQEQINNTEPEIYQREFATATLQEHPFLQTTGVYTCVALVLYSSSQKKGMLAHIDAGTNLDTEIAKVGRDFNWSDVEVSVLGGTVSDRTQLFNRVVAKVKALGGKICMAFQNEGNGDMNLRFDLSNGVISSFSQSHVSTPSDVSRCKVDRIRSGPQLSNFHHGCESNTSPAVDPFQ